MMFQFDREACLLLLTAASSRETAPTMGDSNGCLLCLRFVFTLGLMALFLWLSLRTSEPTCTIEDLYVPSLNQSANAAANTSLYFHLRLKNNNKDKRVYYDALNLTFTCLPASISVANATFPPFRQGHSKKAHRKLTVNHTSPLPRAVNSSLPAVSFRVDLATKVRYRVIFWKTRRRVLDVHASVEVKDGRKVAKGGVKLKSAAPAPRRDPGGLMGCLALPRAVLRPKNIFGEA